MKDIIVDDDGNIINPEALTIPGNLKVNGNTTLGDSAGDGVQINAGNIVAPNANGTAESDLANVGALRGKMMDDWHARRCLEITTDPRNWTKYTSSASFDSGEATYMVARTTASGSASAVATTWLVNGRNGAIQLVGDYPNKSGLTLNKKISISVVIGADMGTANGIAAFYFGGRASRPTAAAPQSMDALGVGFKIENGSIYGVAHNGSSSVTTSSIRTVNRGYYYICLIDMDGLGNATYTVTSPTLGTSIKSVTGALATGEMTPSLEMSLTNNGSSEIKWLIVDSVRVTIDR